MQLLLNRNQFSGISPLDSKMMNVANILKNEIQVFRSRSTWAKCIHLIVLIWLISIPAKNSLYQISTVLIVFTALLHITVANRNKQQLLDFSKRYTGIGLALTTIIATMTLSNTFSELANTDSWIVIGKFTYRYILVLFSLLYFYEQGMFSKRYLSIYILFALSIYSITGVCQGLYTMGSGEWVTSFVYNPNPFGLTMLAGIMTATISLKHVASSSEEHHNQSVGILAVLCTFILALVLSQSRSSWAAAALFLLLMSIHNRHSLTHHKRLLFAVTSIPLLALLVYEPLLTRLLSIFEFSDPNREAIWTNAVTLIRENPVLGYGMVNYRTIGLAEFGGTHNSILEILLFLGAVGLAAYSGVAIVIISHIVRRRHYELLFALFSFFLVSQFNLSILGNKIFLSTLVVFFFFVYADKTRQLEK